MEVMEVVEVLERKSMISTTSIASITSFRFANSLLFGQPAPRLPQREGE